MTKDIAAREATHILPHLPGLKAGKGKCRKGFQKAERQRQGTEESWRVRSEVITTTQMSQALLSAALLNINPCQYLLCPLFYLYTGNLIFCLSCYAMYLSLGWKCLAFVLMLLVCWEATWPTQSLSDCAYAEVNFKRRMLPGSPNSLRTSCKKRYIVDHKATPSFLTGCTNTDKLPDKREGKKSHESKVTRHKNLKKKTIIQLLYLGIL